MIVGYDLTWISSANQFGGVYQYAMRLLQAMLSYSDNKIVVIINPECESLFCHWLHNVNFKLVNLRHACYFNNIIEKENIEIVHSPIQVLPNISLMIPMISTQHDLQQYHFPEFFTNEELLFRNTYYRKSAEFSERIIVSFNHVRDDIVKYYNICSDKIDVCTMGMPEKVSLTSDQIGLIKSKYGLPSQYILYTANTWRHKNHIGLLQGMKILHEVYGIRLPLICTGFQVPDYFPEIAAAVSELGLKNVVRFMGYMPEIDMPAILSGAALAVIPTRYEAGSYPLMEAMSQGVPVLCSHVTSLPETIGDERYLFDPDSPEQMAEKMALILSDERIRLENIENSLKRVRSGSWVNAVKVFELSYRKAIEGFLNKKKQIWFDDWICNYEMLITQKQVQLASERDRYYGELVAIRNSYQSTLSWRITKPLRWLESKFLK